MFENFLALSGPLAEKNSANGPDRARKFNDKTEQEPERGRKAREQIGKGI